MFTLRYKIVGISNDGWHKLWNDIPTGLVNLNIFRVFSSFSSNSFENALGEEFNSTYECVMCSIICKKIITYIGVSLYS